MVVAEPGQQRSKAELTADIRARRRTALVGNVRSRRGRRHYPTVCRQLHHAGLDLLTLRPVADPGGLPQALAAAVDSGADLIVVGGGDGTLSEAAHQLAHRDLCLGVLPLGTTNNFARSLGLPLHLPAALRILTEGKVADVDLGHVAGRHCANLTSLGLSVQVAKHVPHQLKRILRRAAYPLTALALLPRHRPFTARLRINDGTGKNGDDGTGRGVHELVTHQQAAPRRARRAQATRRGQAQERSTPSSSCSVRRSHPSRLPTPVRAAPSCSQRWLRPARRGCGGQCG
jgi:diacylglycerol kinase (ATP)